MLIESSMQLALQPLVNPLLALLCSCIREGKIVSCSHCITRTRSTSCSSFALSNFFPLPLLLLLLLFLYTQSNFLLYGMIISCMNHSLSQLEPKSLESLTFRPLSLSLFRVYKRFNLAPGRLHLQLFLY